MHNTYSTFNFVIPRCRKHSTHCSTFSTTFSFLLVYFSGAENHLVHVLNHQDFYKVLLGETYRGRFDKLVVEGNRFNIQRSYARCRHIWLEHFQFPGSETGVFRGHLLFATLQTIIVLFICVLVKLQFRSVLRRGPRKPEGCQARQLTGDAKAKSPTFTFKHHSIGVTTAA